MKDELDGEVMSEMVGLRSKMYSTDVEDGYNKIKKLAVKR